MPLPQLSIDPSLVQHYLLEISTDEFERVRDTVAKGGEAQQRDQGKVGAWRLFAWLDRPSIWAIRPVGVTSGLDTFLLEENGLDGMHDVSELITCAIGDACGQHDTISNSWEAFSRSFTEPGILFATFLWPNWDALSRSEAWGGGDAPPRSQVLAAIRRSLGAGVARVRAQNLFAGEVNLLLCAATGDCDLVLYGSVQASRDLDACLYLLTQMGSDVLAMDAFGPDRGSKARPWPVFRSTRTEIALDLETYLEAIRAARTDSLPKDAAREYLGHCFAGDFFPEVGLTRGHGPLPQMESRLAHVAGEGWQDRPVFGQEDFIVGSTKARTFAETIGLLARLDAAAGGDQAFPRRSSIRLGTGSLVPDANQLDRAHLFGASLATAAESPPRFDGGAHDKAPDIEPIRRLIVQLRAVGWREDLRIVERMTERCLTLLKSLHLSQETRDTLRVAITRLSTMCRRLETLETALADLRARDHGGDIPATTDALEKLPHDEQANTAVIKKVSHDIRLLRSELLQSGMSLDRVLSHHSRGAVSLLLHRASQARGAEHIGSETGLSMGLGVLFRAPVLRIKERVRASDSLEGDSREWLCELDAKLDEAARPIIYASQDPDFYIRPELMLLRVPRWALWYPAAASHLIHELGHSLAVTGSLAFLMGKVLRRMHVPDYRGDRISQLCPAFERALAALGQPASREEFEARPMIIKRLIDSFFRNDGPSHIYFGANSEKLRELEEIVCDVVARLFSYGAAAEPGDRRQLWDCFDYIAPFTARSDPGANHSLLLRLLAAHTVVRQLRVIRGTAAVKPLAADGMKTLWHVTNQSWHNFQKCLQGWADDFAAREEHRNLPPASRATIVALPGQFADFAYREGRERRQLYQIAAHLIAIVLSLPPLRQTRHQSLFKATHLWGNLVDAAWGPREEESAAAEIIESLQRGCVPGVVSAFPERLPRAVAWKYRENPRHEVPAHVRRALSFYLFDLSQV